MLNTFIDAIREKRLVEVTFRDLFARISNIID